MKREEQKKTSATRILGERYVKGNRKRIRRIEREIEKAEVAAKIYEMRTQAGLSQIELAQRVKTSQSVISRLEDADYRGHSLRMLERVAEALDCRVQIGFVPNGVHATQKG